jgi:hypothetical protein
MNGSRPDARTDWQQNSAAQPAQHNAASNIDTGIGSWIMQ